MMKILHTLPRHSLQLNRFKNLVEGGAMAGFKYICVVIDGPESIDRKASYASDFNMEDTHKLFQALADQTA
jgi:hypothetical protein